LIEADNTKGHSELHVSGSGMLWLQLTITPPQTHGLTIPPSLLQRADQVIE
jgi:hypothetical protein